MKRRLFFYGLKIDIIELSFLYRIISKAKYQISLFLREQHFLELTEQINQLGIHGISLKKLITRTYI